MLYGILPFTIREKSAAAPGGDRRTFSFFSKCCDQGNQ
ncbi:hypothetical protein B4099_1901 [Heyndrickxia coagulans]|uniref:Uncharacterized protein n=1 Tax=Heyndrickxia coagulans TaxID=1398 RepID=A0A150K022_HEYCO|nr:hypothetical protein B4099_1901 [Heyndrickxia coagulans]